MSAKPPVQARVTHRFTVSAERVFDAWLNPEMLGKWMFGCAGYKEEIVSMKTDARVGGAFSFIVRRDGNELDHFGKYLEIERPRRIVFTWAACLASDDHAKVDSSRVLIEIVPVGTGAKLTLIHEIHPDWAHFAERAAGSWRKMLEAMAAMFETAR